MVKTKAQSKKKAQKRGIDFKKIKKKIGRKLPPPKNATNTEIKSKAIVLPEQSVASEKAGLAVSKKGLTLKELLQQTSHHNSKVRRDALIGIKDVFLKHPAELKLHELAVIEKLRERIGDDDKLVCETLYQLFKSVIFPGCKEENNWLYMDGTDPTILDYQITWIRELAPLLILLGDKNPTCSKSSVEIKALVYWLYPSAMIKGLNFAAKANF
ncbi:unnamed protein product [Fraxinus pennsylvanica]|uniref:Uncharacterized protein n=1 Tax=Fraxinus pennsylvanica TaxID=56036 RepID=A0AAD2DIL0_9LAMI|nr:unnamed protein product [Fraxinus pennsylvanica]